jgi:hypothetical protein
MLAAVPDGALSDSPVAEGGLTSRRRPRGPVASAWRGLSSGLADVGDICKLSGASLDARLDTACPRSGDEHDLEALIAEASRSPSTRAWVGGPSPGPTPHPPPPRANYDAQVIPLHKLQTNDGWLVTSGELTAALPHAATMAMDRRQRPIPWWDQWLEYLDAACGHGGFRVHDQHSCWNAAPINPQGDRRQTCPRIPPNPATPTLVCSCQARTATRSRSWVAPPARYAAPGWRRRRSTTTSPRPQAATTPPAANHHALGGLGVATPATLESPGAQPTAVRQEACGGVPPRRPD